MKQFFEKVKEQKWLLRPAFFIVSILWMECVVKVWTQGTLLNRGLWFTLLFTLPAGTLCGLACSVWNERVNKWVAVLLQVLLMVWYGTQAVYYTIFKAFLVLDSLSMAQDAIADFWQNAVDGILKSLLPIVLVTLPLTVLLVWDHFHCKQGKHSPGRMRHVHWRPVEWKPAAILLAAVILLQGAAVLAVTVSDDGLLSPRAVYTNAWTPDQSMVDFGVLTTLRLEAQFIMGWGGDEDDAGPGSMPDDDPEQPSAGSSSAATGSEQPAEQPGSSTPEQPGDTPDEPTVPDVPDEPTPIVYEPNVLDIDFEVLLNTETSKTLKGMHQYFSAREPSMQNEYTGMFEGKNLIFITAEGFWKYAVHEKYTPTLYKLANEGFVFNEFYNPLWWKSTTDGEYAACTGLIPSSKVRSFKQSGSNSMPFCMGNMLGAQGYPTMAYHNHTYTYYNRNISHPNMGYEYYGLGNGLEVRKTWPESDLEMMEKTIPQALAGEMPFHNYYMTVSGHMNYNFLGNYMAGKHKSEVADLEMSEEARAYIACNMEFDQAMAYVLEQLEAAGQLENTVICISGDHYPYGMNPETWNEFYGGEMDTDFEIYRSTLILWSGDMQEPVVVDKPCSSLDILPTLLNLFGLEYDSRLLAGTDILSDSPGLAVFKNRSFITEEGRYNARTDTWTPNEGSDKDMTYASQVYSHVKDLFNYSVKILDNDYYGVLGLGNGKRDAAPAAS